MCFFFFNSHLLPVFDEAVDGDVVDDVPGADDQRVAVLPQQLEVVRVRVVPEEAVGHTCGEIKEGNSRSSLMFKIQSANVVHFMFVLRTSLLSKSRLS